VSKSAASELYPNEDEDSGPYARAAHASIKSEFRLESKHYSLREPHLCKCGDKRAVPRSKQGENPAKAGRASLAGVWACWYWWGWGWVGRRDAETRDRCIATALADHVLQYAFRCVRKVSRCNPALL